MSGRILQALAAWLAAGENRIGQVVISGEFELRHYMDIDAAGDALVAHTKPSAAREIGLYDAAGAYRPLKTAPNLRRGWRIVVSSIEELHETIDAFYPAMLALRLASEEGRLAVTSLRETLGRQSGMYAIARRITDGQANAMIGALCNSETGCLKHILWRIAPDVPITSLPPDKFSPAPLLCAEACNLLVAKAREVVKESAPPAS